MSGTTFDQLTPKRLILSIDASTDRTALGLTAEFGRFFANDPHDFSCSQHGWRLVPGLRQLFDEQGFAVRDLNAIAIGAGPGSFTGLRIAWSAAKTLAYAMDVPLFEFDSLRAIAINALDQKPYRPIAVAVPAQRGEIFAADFRIQDPYDLIQELPTRIVSVEEWKKTLGEVLVLGPNLHKLGHDWPPQVILGDDALGRPRGETMAKHLDVLLGQAESLNVWFAEPAYLRRSAAEEKADAKAQSRTP